MGITWCLCLKGVACLGGGLVNNIDRFIWWRDGDDFIVKLFGEIVLFAHVAGGGRIDGSITCVIR
eukprot:2740725-Ditylum_brightwellii.AAC.1